MQFVYFTKSLPAFGVSDWIAWCLEYRIQGLDLAVRPGYPVTPDNVATILPKWAEMLAKEKLSIGLVTAPTDLNNPEDKRARTMFRACKAAGVAAIKIGYFGFSGGYPQEFAKAKAALSGFAELAKETGVKVLHHTHSGGYLGNNAAGQRLIFEGIDPHYLGSFLDTGHLALGGGPFAQEVELIKPWFSCLAIKDIEWFRDGSVWKNQVVPVGSGIVRWAEVGKALKKNSFDGTVSLHGEYAMEGPVNRGRAAALEKSKILNEIK